MLGHLKITKFLERTAAGTAAPGGGSVAALNAALGASLVEMVANLTLGKKGYEAAAKDMSQIAADASKLRKKLVNDIDKDAAAYTEVMRAFEKPNNTDKQKKQRSAAIQAGLKNAALVPLGVARDALAIMDLAGRVMRKGNKNALTDGAVAGLTAKAAVMGALFNVKTNLDFIKDHKFISEITQEVDRIENRIRKKEKEILSLVDL